MRGLIVAICLVLAGCTAAPPPAPVAAAPPPAPPPPKPPPPKMVWVRVDGQYPPGWQQQGDVDYASCDAVAINASNQQRETFDLIVQPVRQHALARSGGRPVSA